MIKNPLKILVSILALMTIVGVGAAPTDVSNIPLFLAQPVGFNLMVTIDDSGSMDWEELPDNMVGSGTMRGSANSYNPVAYDPSVTYIVPPWPDATGTIFATMPVPTFNQAFDDGFAYATGTATGTSAAGVGGNYAANSTSNLNNNFQFNQRQTSERAYYAIYDPNLTQSVCPVPNKSSNFCYVKITLNANGSKSYFKSTPACANINNVNNNNSCFTVAIPNSTPPAGVVDAADETQNFAIWYSYYRKRTLLAKSAALRALSTLPTNTRVGCHVINSNGAATTTCSQTIDFVREFSGTNQLAQFQRIARIPVGNSTPLKDTLRRVGAYFQTTGVNSPWAYVPGTTLSPQLACRRSYHLMLTDGYYNSNSGVPATMSAADTTAVALLPDGKTSYDGKTKPYAGIDNGTLADIAFYYWTTNLNPSLAANKVPPSIGFPNSANPTAEFWDPNNDPATWPHLVNFNVALGLSGSITPVDAAQRDLVLANLTSGVTVWPTPVDNTNTAIDDLWHAAVNSRGDFYSAAKSDELVTAFQDIINRTQVSSGSAAGISVTSATANGKGFAYQSTFDSSNWTGQITAYPISADGSFGPKAWTTSDSGKIPAFSAGTRKIDTLVDGVVKPFTYGNLNAAQQSVFLGPIQSTGNSKIVDVTAPAIAAMPAGQKKNPGDMLADYLKGDPTFERTNKGGVFRQRLFGLGDILNSGVLYVAGRDFGWGSTGTTGSADYAAYVAKKETLPRLLVTGANDGMVHFFDAATGVETYNFIPPVLMNKLYQLALPSYGHQYYVDGQLSESDYYANGAWHTAVIGTTGLGGAGVFAFDVSNRSAPQLLWYIDANSNNCSGLSCADLGYGIGAVRVTQFGDGKWYAVFGNGYESGVAPASATPGQAKLFSVLMDGNIAYNATPSVSQVAVGAAGANGLSTPAIVRGYNRLYAGDLKGNMWRFDVPDTAGPKPVPYGSNTKPLFTAKSSSGVIQPITSRPNVFSPKQGGIMVAFGTGRLYKQSDLSDLTVQSIYSVWDTSPSAGALPYTRSSLVQQTILTEAGTNPTYRTTSNNVLKLGTDHGWYLDLIKSSTATPTGERVLATPLIAFGRTDFTTYVPTGTSPTCEVNSNSFFMSLGSFSGDMGTVPVFDTNGDGVINGADGVYSGFSTGGTVSSPSGEATTEIPAGGNGPMCVKGVDCCSAGLTCSCGSLAAADCKCAAGMSIRSGASGALSCVPNDACGANMMSVRIAQVASTNTTVVCMPTTLSQPRMGWREIE